MPIKISTLNQDRLIFVVCLILIAMPFVTTLGLPLPVSNLTREFYNTIETLPEGSTVLWVNDIEFVLYAEIGSGQVAICKRLFDLARERDIKIIFASTVSAQAWAVHKMIMSQVDTSGLEYGENWVELGWLPGFETALAGLARNIRQIAPTDAYGTPLDQIPMMKDINSIENFTLLGWGGYYIDPYARQWTGFGKTIIVNISATNVALAKPWFEKGLINAYLNGQRGCAEYEALTGYKGMATSAMDAQSLTHLMAIILLIIPNIYFLMTRSRRMR